jgi:hypothetical protein
MKKKHAIMIKEANNAHIQTVNIILSSEQQLTKLWVDITQMVNIRVNDDIFK